LTQDTDRAKVGARRQLVTP